MKKRITRAHIRYWIDCIMSRGTVAMTLLLAAATLVTVTLLGTAAYLLTREGALLYQVWTALMHTLDAGTLADVDASNIPYMIVMSLATLFGLFVTSVLIGVVAAGVEGKLQDLRRGASVVQEEDHTVIIGFDSNAFDLLGELLLAADNQKRSCIVILGQQEKTEMEDAIAARFPATGRTRIICRSGTLHDSCALKLCAIRHSRSVIINVHEDAAVIKVLLAVSSLLNESGDSHPGLHIIASIQDMQNLEAARIAGEGRACIVCAKDAIARIIANTCRQHGLSQVLTELFNFIGNEMYIEPVPALHGKTFAEALRAFDNAVPVGILSGSQARLNPPGDTRLGEGDALILLEEDDGAFHCHAPHAFDASAIVSGTPSIDASRLHLTILGSNDKLPTILREYDHYAGDGSRVVIIDNDLDERVLPPLNHLEVTLCRERVNRPLLCRCLADGAANLLLLNDDSQDPEASDAQTLMNLLLLRDIADKNSCRFAVTTEMRSAENQRLADRARVDDFVIGSNFISLLMAQLSESPALAPIIDDLLDEDGSELYMKPARDYILPGASVDGYTLAEAAARRGEIFVGYRRKEDSGRVIINPVKTERVTFAPDDQLVVIAME